MSLESFIGSEQSEGMSASSLEQLREKMKKASAQIAAIKKEEKKRKKKEQELQKILLKFIQNSQKSELVLLISRVLEQNIPANFVLAVVLLGNEDIQQELGSFLLPPAAATALAVKEATESDAKSEDHSLVFFDPTDQSLPLRIKIEVDNWIKNILAQAHESPHKLIATAWQKTFVKNDDGEKEEHKDLKEVLVNLAAHVLYEFLLQHEKKEPMTKMQDFCHFILTGILNKTEEELDNRAFLE